MRTLIIWGAGRIGRGFVADLFHHEPWRIVFVDIDKALVDALNARGEYTIFKATAEGITPYTLKGGFSAVHTGDSDALGALFREEGLMLDIAVHEPKLGEVADMLAPLFTLRAESGAGAMDVMMNVNMTSPDEAFLRLMRDRLTGAARDYFDTRVGVTGIAAMCISPVATDEMREQDPLAVLNNAWPEQAIGKARLKGEPPRLERVRLSDDVHAEETRKLYTLNMAHALCCYLGLKKGYATVIDVMKDPGLRALTRQALDEACLGLTQKFGFDPDVMAAWPDRIIGLLDNPSINDNLPRLGADTRRKLGPSDRLCGPARLCLAAGGRPEAIARALRAGFDYEHDDPGTRFVRDKVSELGLPGAIGAVCGLAEGDPLRDMILQSDN